MFNDFYHADTEVHLNGTTQVQPYILKLKGKNQVNISLNSQQPLSVTSILCRYLSHTWPHSTKHLDKAEAQIKQRRILLLPPYLFAK